MYLFSESKKNLGSLVIVVLLTFVIDYTIAHDSVFICQEFSEGRCSQLRLKKKLDFNARLKYHEK